jgi:hypothetical protein
LKVLGSAGTQLVRLGSVRLAWRDFGCYSRDGRNTQGRRSREQRRFASDQARFCPILDKLLYLWWEAPEPSGTGLQLRYLFDRKWRGERGQEVNMFLVEHAVLGKESSPPLGIIIGRTIFLFHQLLIPSSIVGE